CGDEWVTKWDGAENTEKEAVKGGLSGAMKRAAVQWGIGRYLYQLEEGWANVHEGGQYSAQTKDKKWFRWDPPALPAWALPDGVGKPNERPVQAQTASSGDGSSPDVGSSSGTGILVRTIPFGKHKGKTWAQILDVAPDYVEWAVEN